MNIPNTYKLIKNYDLKDIDTKGSYLLHKKSGAKVVCMENDDPNKVFYIGFRTTPTDSTGVAHILEHSVLCGSKKYPLKDPFVELAKGSLNTFLNAMTYPDKTVYPIASENDKDFANLTDVYMDAVFNPNIYENEKIFKQEGWHYEVDEKTKEIIYNGVVYNEMKGAFSSPDDVLEREVLNGLFPDNTYAYESGGDPIDIPSLTYEDFLNFHKRYYHPSNSYIYIYGDCDMEERLSFLDREYLSKYDRIDPDSSILKQEPFGSYKERVVDYPIAVGDDVENNTYFCDNFVVGDILDPTLYQAFSVLDYALLNSPGAPLREALIKKGIGKDITGGYSNGTLQPYFSIGVKGAKPSNFDLFKSTCKETLENVVKNGLDKKSLKAAINVLEFNFREADYGHYPKGLVYGLICLDSWIYDDDAPFTHLYTIPVLDELKTKIDTDYFEKLIQKYLIDNNHRILITLNPKEGLEGERQEAVAKKLAEFKETIGSEKIEEIARAEEELKIYQTEPTAPEDLLKLPMLSRGDLRKTIRPIKNRLKNIGDTPVLFHDIQTNGINYLSMVFNVDDVKEEDVSALSLMSRMIGLLDTENYTYAELSNEINILTGGIYSNLNTYSESDGTTKFVFTVGGKYLCGHTDDAIRLALEMMLKTKFSDKGRMRELLDQEISHFKMRIASSGHMVSSLRSSAGFSKEAAILERTSGIEFYKYLKNLDKNFDAEIEKFKDMAESFVSAVFRKSGLFVSVTGMEKDTADMETFVPEIVSKLSDTKGSAPADISLINNGNEAFKTASAIQYVAKAGNFKHHENSYSGAFMVLKTIMAYEYLWKNIRVKGGAYGCMSSFKRTGDTYFVSYRDPNLKNTIEVFNDCPDYIAEFDCDERDMTKYVIGTISTVDTPLSPAQEGERGLTCYLSNLTENDLQKSRNEILEVNTEAIRALSKSIKDVMDENRICVLGSETAIDECKDIFDSIVTLV